MYRTYLVALAALLTLAACGSGGSENTAGIDGRGTPTPVAVVSQGSITGFGSVIVNGVRFETDAASFEIDGVPGSQDDLAVGDVVLIAGTISDDGTTGSASTVTFDDVVEGPVTAINTVASQLTVLGQTVQVGGDTSFDNNISPASLEGISAGDVVEVSGFRLADGTISATRIEAKPAGGEFEITGIVSNLSGMSLAIAGLTVDFSSALLSNFPNGMVENGQTVEARGTALGVNGELLATRVEFKGGGLGAAAGDRAELEGFITRFASAQDFDVSGIPVTTSGTTVFQGGTAGDLGLNIKVEVDGDINGDGVLVADRVDIRRSNKVRMAALVDSVDAGNGSLVMLGITVQTDNMTRIEDKSAADLRPFTLANLNAGDYVEVRGDEFPAGSDTIAATILERDDINTDTILQGFVESVSDPSYSLLGVSIQTTGATVFRDFDGSTLTSFEFFNRLGVNDLVKAKGTESTATTITATEVSFENAF